MSPSRFWIVIRRPDTGLPPNGIFADESAARAVAQESAKAVPGTAFYVAVAVAACEVPKKKLWTELAKGQA